MNTNLTGTFTDTAKDGETTMSLGNVIDQFLNQDGLSDTGTAKETNFTTTSIGRQQIDNLDASFQDFGRRGLIDKLWRRSCKMSTMNANKKEK
jgi:hypothetical protein